MREDSRRRSAAILEGCVSAHVLIYIFGVSWAFGGNADWVRFPICLWGSAGMLLTAAAICLRVSSGPGRSAEAAAWCAPIILLNAMVLVSCLTPGFREVSYGGEGFLMPLRIDWWIPSAARANIALGSLWLFDGLYFSALNLALAVNHKGTLRRILAAAVCNGVLLAIFGTVQKLVGSTGIYFGTVKSPQDYFFASFVYDNHWGAFTILTSAICVGLVLRYAFGSRGYGFFYGPSLLGIVAAALLALSIPFSGARACTLLLAALLIVAILKGASSITKALHRSGVTPGIAYSGILIAAVAFAWGAWTIAGDVMQSRTAKAEEQVSAILAQRGIGSRGVLYRDTFRMARARPVFGWGMGSFPTVFALYNTQVPKGDRIPVVYHDAHNDWLQCVAELGIAGALLMVAAVALPARALLGKRLTPLPFFLILGCALVGTYALVEFPFGNVAVVLLWWLSFMSAVQYVRLSPTRKEAQGEH